MNQTRNANAAFTMVEILIVVVILGILAAIVFPEYQSHAQQAKESAAMDNLRLLRQAIELYAAQHKGVAPGYPNGDTGTSPSFYVFRLQLVTAATNEQGQCQPIGTPGYPYGPYLSEMPENPLNNLITLTLIANTDDMPVEPTGATGWIYKPASREIRLDWPGTDSKGVSYYDY